MGTFSFCELNVYPPMRFDTYSMNECHFFITTIIMIRRNKMIEMSFKTLIIKVLVFILSNFLSSRRLEVDTQQLNVPKLNVAYKIYASTPNGSRVLGSLKLRIPVFGMLATKTACARFSRTLSTLLAAGMPLIEAIEITGKTLDNVLFKDALTDAVIQVQRGAPLSAPLKASGIFPNMVLHMLSIGEESGNTEEMLTKLADYYDEEVEMAVQSLMAAMEPMIIVVLAGVCGILIGACMAPMLSMYGALDKL